MGAEFVQVTLVPVRVFGEDSCCEHDPEGFGISDDCPSAGYGLMDAVSWWSDCNRAVGHIYRFEDCLGGRREQGETLTVWVDPDEYEAFSKRKFDE